MCNFHKAYFLVNFPCFTHGTPLRLNEAGTGNRPRCANGAPAAVQGQGAMASNPWGHELWNIGGMIWEMRQKVRIKENQTLMMEDLYIYICLVMFRRIIVLTADAS